MITAEPLFELTYQLDEGEHLLCDQNPYSLAGVADLTEFHDYDVVRKLSVGQKHVDKDGDTWKRIA